MTVPPLAPIVVIRPEGSRRATADALRNAGFAVVEAASLSGAFGQLSSAPAVIVVSAEGGDSGNATELRSDPETAGVPIVHLWSGYKGAAARVAGMAAGGSVCLAPDVGDEELCATVRALAEIRRVPLPAEPDRETAAHSNEMMHAHDLQGNFRWVNDGAVRLTGYSREQLLRMNLQDLLVPEFRHLMTRYLAGVSRRRTARGEMVIETAGGKRRRLEYHNTLQRHAVDAPVVWGFAWDVTARRRAEQESRASEARLRAAERLAGVGSWEWDVRTRQGKWSAQMFRHFALQPADDPPSFEEYLERVHPDDRDVVAEVLVALTEGREPPEQEFRTNPALGPVRTFRPTLSCERDGHGQALRYSGTVLDVTAAREAEATHRELEEQYRLLVDRSPYAIAVHQDGRLAFVNRAALALLGASSEEEVLSRPISDFVHPSGWEAARDRIRRMLAGEGGLYPVDDEYVRLDGTVVPVEMTAAPFTFRGKPAVQVIALDLTGKREAAAAREASERRYRQIVANIPGGLVIIFDRDFRYVLAAGEELAHFGLSGEQMAGKRVEDIMPAEAAAAVRASYEPVLRGETVTTEDEFGGRHYLARATPLIASPGAEPHILILAINITERKKAEEALRGREALLQRAFDHVPDVVAVYGPDLRMRYINEAIPAYPDRRRADLIGHTMDELFSGDMLRDLLPPLRAALETKTMQRLDVGWPPPNPGVRAGQYAWIPVLDDGGNVLEVVAIFHDMTEAKEAEAELHEAQERLERIVHAGDVGLWDWDLRTNDVYYSPEWKRQIGYEDYEITNAFEEWNSRVHPDDLAGAMAAVEAHLQGTTTDYETEFRFRHKDGTYRYILAQGSKLLDEEGTPIRLLGSHVDITERTELQAQLLQSQKMDTVGQLAGGIAHDFNNLINVINGTAALAADGLLEGDQMLTDLREIQRAGERAATLTRQLLAFSRRQLLKPETFDLGALLGEMRRMLERVIGEDIELSVVAPRVPCTITADPGQMEQVVLNLVVNARDAMPAGGTLQVEVRSFDPADTADPQAPVAEQGSHVMLTVRDTGAGMSEETRRRIFEPFFTTKERGRGTGLGLSTVYGIVEQSGGTISVESTPGKGTTFRIYLPAGEPSAATTPAAGTAQPAHGTETVLVVEDYLGLRELARRILRASGYAVLAARNGDEALRLLEAHSGPVDLLVTDVVLPGIGGRELAAQVSELYPGIKVLFTSGYTDDALLRHGVQADLVDFLPKPYANEDLARAVRGMLDRK